jgi:molybdopterin-guanine dinucleotide biosynthesis protein A
MMRSAVILAGGKSKRFGRDKGLAILHGKLLVRHVMDSLLPLVDETIISISKSPGQSAYRKKIRLPVRLVEDRFFELGPLGGLISAFEQARGEYIAVAPCDAPLIMTGLYNMLFELAEGADGAVPVINGYYEPLHAVYQRKRMLAAMEKVLAGGKTKPVEAYRHMRIVDADEGRVRRTDPRLDSFVNLNTPADLRRAQSKQSRPVEH